jgi:hypothetical protein
MEKSARATLIASGVAVIGSCRKLHNSVTGLPQRCCSRFAGS